jgi:hypothetical protein
MTAAGSAGDPPPPPVAVVDIDGVVADVRHRLHHLSGRPKNWPAFFAAAADDPPLAEGLRLVHELARDHEVIWLTGRPERLRSVTTDWLVGHALPAATLLMRADTDRRPARLLKRDRLRAVGRRHRVAVVVDDDPQVVDALAADGWPVRLADWVPYSAPLRLAQEQQGRT